MINGVYLSELETVRKRYLSHYRKLQDILNQQQPRLSQLDTSLTRILQHRKIYHVSLTTPSKGGSTSKSPVINHPSRVRTRPSETKQLPTVKIRPHPPQKNQISHPRRSNSLPHRRSCQHPRDITSTSKRNRTQLYTRKIQKSPKE